MEPKKYSDQIIKTIESRDIKPKPKWTFLLKDYVMWALGILSLLIGGLAFSAVIFIMRNNDWDVYMHFSNSLLKYFFLTAPYLWIVLLILFILAAHYNYSHTDKGYKYEIHKIVLAIIVISGMLGVGFYNIGVGRAIDEGFADRSELYRKALNHKQQRWNTPERGFLSGQITHTNGDILLKDSSGKSWKIIPPQNKPVPKNLLDKKLRLIGRQIDEHTFQAEGILPFNLHQGQFDVMRKLDNRNYRPRP